ncbi:unnamed protein product [Sympodiomycopsis kandeliae]
MEEFGGPSGAPPAEEDFTKMPIEDRLKHKNWKARSSAYEELTKKFSATAYDSDPEFKPYVRNPDLLKTMVMDSNVVAQEKGVLTVSEFVRFGGKAAGSTRETVLPAVVEKCLGSARAGTKKAAIELVLLYAENEDVMGSEGLVMDVIAGLTAKQPKLVAGTVSALKELVKEFGPKQVSPKAILKKLPDVFAHSDKTVRSEGSLLAQELHRYLGPALDPTIDSLKDIQAKELRAQFEEIDRAGAGKPLPPRNLLSQKAAAEAAAVATAGAGASSSADVDGSAAGEAGISGDADEGEFDAYEMAEPVDPMKAKEWPSNFDDQVKAAKWSERKEAFEAAKNVLANNIKLEPGNSFDNFVDACVERIRKDATVHVWLMACQCLEAAAKGMRTGFAKYRERTMPPMLEKYKEKKASTVEVLSNTLDAIFQTVSFGDILEDVLAAAKHKNPNVKTESIRYLARCLRETRKPPAKGDIKPIADALLAACSDGSGDVRDAGTQGMGTLMKLIGERPMNSYVDQLDDIKKAKVQEEFKNAIVKVKMGGAAPQVASARPAAAVPRPAAAARGPAMKPREVAKPAQANKENVPTSRTMSPAPPAKIVPKGPPARLAAPARAPVASSSSAKPATRPAPAASSSRSTASKAGAPSANEPVKFRFNSEDAEARASDLIPSDIAAQVANSNWKERLAGMQAFSTWLDREAESVESEIIIRALSKKPGWKESNFQVMAEVYKIFKQLAEQCPTFGRASIALSVQPLCDKLGDIKLKTPASETLGAYSEATSFGFVLRQALGPLAALKAPKAIADSLLWIDSSIQEFGIQGVDVRSLVDHLLTCLKSANAAVRNNATTVVGTLARYLGSSLTNFLGDLNPQLRTTIEGEIGKAADNPAPAPTRFCAELKPVASAGGGGGVAEGAADAAAASAAAEEEALDALIPRVDVDRLIPSSAISSMGDSSWKVRKEALEEIQSILQANTRLKGTLSEVTPALKLRYADSNLMCKTLALDIATKLAAGLGKNFEPQAKTFVTPITLCLADAKAPLRQSAMVSLTAIAEAVGTDNMISGMASALEGKAGANPMLRQELFGWLAARFEAHPPGKNYDLAPLALPAVQCLDDKLAAVKKAAQAALPYIIQRAGYKFVCSQADSMKAASKNSVLPLIDQARTAANALAPAKAAASAPAPESVRASARPPPAMKKVAAISAASSSRPQSPLGRTASPAPASPRTSGLARSGASRPMSAATRTLQPPSSRIASAGPSASSAATSGLARPAFNSRLGAAKKAVMASSSAVSSSATGHPLSAKDAPLLTADPKHKLGREKKEGRLANWVSAEGTARQGLGDILRSQCEHHLGISLVDAMFSTDHNAERDYLSALTILTDFISSPTFAEEEYGIPQSDAVARVVGNSDLVFKYIALRLTDNNTSISLKCFEVLGHLLDLLRTEQYHMSDYEANCILPCLIAKFGDAKVAFRDRIRETFRKLAFIFPPSKLVTHYLENGLPSKNARTRAECLAELGFLFSKNGLQVCTPSRTLPVIAKQISDRDANVRTAALLALGECYKIVGDDIWGLVGRLPEKEMSLLEERLKRTIISRPVAAASTAAKIGSPAGARQSIAGGIRPPGMRSSSGIVPPSALSKSRIGTTAASAGIPRPSARASMLPGPFAVGNGSPQGSPSVSRLGLPAGVSVDAAAENAPEELPGKDTAEQQQEDTQLEEDEEGEPDIEQTINEILSSEPERSTAALKAIHQELAAFPAPFASFVDQLAGVLAKQFGKAFKMSDAEDPANSRLKKYLIQVSSSLFDAKNKSDEGHTLASYIDRRALAALMTQLLQRLIDFSHQAKEQDDARLYATYLNKIVIRCFGSCNLNVLYSTSFAMLADASEDLRDLSGDILRTRFEFSELIIKCLWKVGRRLPNALEDNAVDPSELMFDTENFLQRVGPEEWKARARDEVPLADLPLRTIKVILSHLVSALGEDVLNYFGKIESPEHSHIYAYMIAMLNQTNDEDGEVGDVITGQGSEKGAAAARQSKSSTESESDHKRLSSNGTTGPNSAAEDTASSELRDIFERISQKDQSRKAIKDLYEFQKKYPSKQSHIDRSLQGTGPIFQRYIKRALANHAAEDESATKGGKSTDESAVEGVKSAGSDVSSARSSHTQRNSAHHLDGAPDSDSNSGQIGIGRPSSIRSSVNAGDSPSRRTSSISGHVRSASSSTSAAEDRLAQLRAKFYNKTPVSPNSSGAGSKSANAEDSV